MLTHEKVYFSREFSRRTDFFAPSFPRPYQSSTAASLLGRSILQSSADMNAPAMQTISTSIFHQISTEDPNCEIDLAFVVDASGSVRDDWDTLLKFVVNVSKNINVSPEGSHIALVKFGDQGEKVLDFEEFDPATFKEDNVLQKITSIGKPPSGASRYINRGLREVNEQVFQEEFGMRPDVQKVGCCVLFH